MRARAKTSEGSRSSFSATTMPSPSALHTSVSSPPPSQRSSRKPPMTLPVDGASPARTATSLARPLARCQGNVSDVEEAHVLGIVLDPLAAVLHVVAHQLAEDLV